MFCLIDEINSQFSIGFGATIFYQKVKVAQNPVDRILVQLVKNVYIKIKKIHRLVFKLN